MGVRPVIGHVWQVRVPGSYVCRRRPGHHRPPGGIRQA
jgi:hypothetical protein